MLRAVLFHSMNKLFCKTREADFPNPFNDYPDAVFSLDLKGNFLSTNKALLNLTECTREELLKLSFVPFIANEDFEKVFSYFQKAIQGKIQNFETKAISAKGTPYILNITNLPIVVNQEIIGVHVIAKDITAQRKTEKQLNEYHRKTSNILESITDGFFAVDRSWTITYWNKEAEHIIGISRQNIIGRNLWEIFPKSVNLKFFSEQHRAMSENISVRFEEYSPTAGGFIEVSAFPSEDGLSIYFKDITERKNTDQLLNQEKEKYRSLFNLSPIPKWVYDVETLQFLDVNEASIKHYGFSREEFLAMTIKDIRPKEDIPILEEIINIKVKKGGYNSSSVRHVKKSGKVIHVNVESNYIKFDGKNARLILAIDVTEKLKAEQALEASEQRFKALVQDGSDLIGIMDTAGNYLYVSPTSKSILGIDADFFIGKNAFDFIHEEDKERVIMQFQLLSSKKRIKIAPFRFSNLDNKYRWIETIITDMTNDPAVAGIVANSRDVTERIENEIKTTESIERYNTVSKATSDTIYDWDIPNDKITWNKGIKGIFGHKQTDNCTHEWWYSRVHPEDVERVVKGTQLLIKNKKSRQKSEYRFRCADGAYKFVLDRGFLIYDSAGQPVRMIGAMQDITERIKYIRAIENQNKRLREISWVQSHLIRAPLASILGIINLLSDTNETDGRLLNELLPLLKKSAEDLDAVIHKVVIKAHGF